MDQIVIGIDPGREKCGIAAVHSRTGVMHVSVVPTTDIAVHVRNLVAKYGTNIIILGNGTSHRQAKSSIEADGSFNIQIIDEAHTTEQARIRYWQENPPRGLRKLIPLGLQVPPEPVDGYVAAILAERWLSSKKD